MMQFVSRSEGFCSLTSSWAFNVPSTSTYDDALRREYIKPKQITKGWWKTHSFCRVVPNATFSSDTTISRTGPFGETWWVPVLIGSDTVGRCLPVGYFGGRGRPRSATRGVVCGGSGADGGGGRDRSTIERRASTHVAELGSLRPSATSHSPAGPGCGCGAPGAPATANTSCHSLPGQPATQQLTRAQKGGILRNAPRAMNSTRANLDTRMRSWNCARENCTVNAPLPLRGSSTVTKSTESALPSSILSVPRRCEKIS